MNENIKQFCKKLLLLMEEHNVNIGLDMGDDDWNGDGFYVADKNDEVLIKQFDPYLDAYDLIRFLEDVK